jgi:hypothetical protein
LDADSFLRLGCLPEQRSHFQEATPGVTVQAAAKQRNQDAAEPAAMVKQHLAIANSIDYKPMLPIE